MKKLIGALMILMQFACSSTWWSSADTVTVEKGDTLYSISRRYDVSLKDLIGANSLEAPYTLYVGQQLRLPSQQYHTVQRGESLYGIARMYNVEVTELSRVNNLQTPYSLSVGQKLILPASAAVSSGTSSPVKSTSSAATVATKQTKQIRYVQAKTSSAATTAPKARKTKFDWPVKGTIISGYGNLGNGRKNDGINIKAARGTNVKASDSGKVAYAGNELKGFGNLILIKHSDGWITAYAHNDKLFVKKGQTVQRGEKIATVGSTGSVTTPQLHFEVRAGKKAVNPRPYLP